MWRRVRSACSAPSDPATPGSRAARDTPTNRATGGRPCPAWEQWSKYDRREVSRSSLRHFLFAVIVVAVVPLVIPVAVGGIPVVEDRSENGRAVLAQALVGVSSGGARGLPGAQEQDHSVGEARNDPRV